MPWHAAVVMALGAPSGACAQARPLDGLEQYIERSMRAWAIPGLGFILIGQRARGITVGVTVVGLFALGLLIGGVRALEVPMVEREEVQAERLDAVRDAARGATVKEPA